MSLLPLPEAIYPNPDIAFTAAQLYASQHGYALSKHDKKPSRVVFICNRAGQYNSKGKDLNTHKSKQRQFTGLKKCGCLMKVEVRLDRVSN